MDIKIHRAGKKTLIKYKVTSEDAEKEMHRLLDPYKNRLPEGFSLCIKNVGSIGSSASFSNKISLDAKFISEYITAKKEEKEINKRRILECIGHELGHKRVTYNYLWDYAFTSPNRLFLPHLIEIYCDHYSTRFTGLTRDEHKEILGCHVDGKDRRTWRHPSWKDRITYLEQEFGEDLIRTIAKDYNCTNEKTINKQIEYYKKVEEKDGSVIWQGRINNIANSSNLMLYSMSKIIRI